LTELNLVIIDSAASWIKKVGRTGSCTLSTAKNICGQNIHLALNFSEAGFSSIFHF